MSIIPVGEPVRIQVCCRLGADTCSQTVDEVLGNHRVHRSYIHLTWMLLRTSIHEVLYQCLQTEDDELEALDILDVCDEAIHRALTLGELYGAVLVPEVIIPHLGIRLMSFLLFTLEQFLVDLVEIVVLRTRCPDDDHLTEELGH